MRTSFIHPMRGLLLVSLVSVGCCTATSEGDAGGASMHDDAGASLNADAGGASMNEDAGTAGSESARRLSLSPTHGCVLREAGLYCWGDNDSGQLGTGDTTAYESPVRAEVAGSDVVEVATVNGRTCVRRAGGSVSCWGMNEYGQLGDGTRESSTAAVEVVGLEDAVQLALDQETSCALRRSGEVVCWGGSRESAPEQGSLEPAPVTGLSEVVELSGGVIDTYCARGTPGWVRCFRRTDDGWSAPADAPDLTGARAIVVVGNDLVCGITPERELLCQNLETGANYPLLRSEGSLELVGTVLVACARNEMDRWQCWNVLTPLLELHSVGPLDTGFELDLNLLAVGGFTLCGTRDDNELVCVDANDPEPIFEVIDGLPD